MLGDDPAYNGMDISTKSIVCTTLDENGNIVRKDSIENSFEKFGEFLGSFSPGDSFVMELTGFYEPLYDFIESREFSLKLANPLKIKLIAESRMKNDDVDSEILAKLLRNDWILESDVPPKKIREIRGIVRTRIQISQSMRSYKNRIRYELLRMHVDYEVDPFSKEGKIFLWNLHNPRIDSYVSVINGLEKEIHKIDESIAQYG